MIRLWVWKREEACMYSGRLECWAATSSVWHGASRSNGRARKNRCFPTEVEARQRQGESVRRGPEERCQRADRWIDRETDITGPGYESSDR